jgi:HD-GYP domain-containing protein (c-di-GMP phosphodiesterase class II)
MSQAREPDPQQWDVPLVELVTSLSAAMDNLDPVVVHHHKQVACIALAIAEELDLRIAERTSLVLAAALHDIGAFSLRERRESLHFEFENPMRHAARGYAILRLFSPLVKEAEAVRFHHVPWAGGRGRHWKGVAVPRASHIIHLADRVAILVQPRREILGQVRRITAKIRANAGVLFDPQLVEAFLGTAARESFWLDLVSSSLETILSRKLAATNARLGLKEMAGFSRLFSRVIDFKSPFTAGHSSGVAACAALLGRLCGMDRNDEQLMRIAGNLHDLGKLAVSSEILDKPSRLNAREYHQVQHHAFHTRRLLEGMPSLGPVIPWASDHHERLDGSGYPFHLRGGELSLGAQIMGVADIFTALTENRPYRSGMSHEAMTKVMWAKAKAGELNGDIVNTLCKNCERVDRVRIAAQAAAALEYRSLPANA